MSTQSPQEVAEHNCEERRRKRQGKRKAHTPSSKRLVQIGYMLNDPHTVLGPLDIKHLQAAIEELVLSRERDRGSGRG